MATIIAEFCSHDLYHGWHLYRRDRADGSRNDDGSWGLLSGHWRIAPVHARCRDAGHDPPDPPSKKPWDNCQRFAEWFAATYPDGMPW